MDISELARADAPPTPQSSQWLVSTIAFSLFFIFGSITSLNDILMPKLKELFHLTYGEMTLVQFCFFASYFLVSVPASILIAKVGYMVSVIIGLALIGLGCLLFIPAASTALFPAFLTALFVVAAGITVVQVTANPLVVKLGSTANTPARLTFAHACNSIGTVVAPYFGAMFILDHASSLATPDTLTGAALAAHRSAQAGVISEAYAAIAVAVAVVIAFVWIARNRLGDTRTQLRNPLAAFGLLRRPRVIFGVVAMFLYVGAEVTIGSLLVNYLHQSSTLSLPVDVAGKHLAFYWGGLLIGRLLGLVVLRLVRAPKLLIAYGLAAGALVLISISVTGPIAGWSMLAVGLCNSIMFPVIFALTSEGLGARAAEGSGLTCVAIVGGAVVPLLTGYMADLAGLTVAFVIPAICYLGIVAFGWYVVRQRSVV